MTAYAIAKYIPMEARRAACEQVYTPINKDPGSTPDPRNVEGCCPIGFALAHIAEQTLAACPDDDALLTAFVRQPAAPSAIEAVRLLQRYGIVSTNPKRWPKRINWTVQIFIEQWDAGLISDLYDALDVPREAVPE